MRKCLHQLIPLIEVIKMYELKITDEELLSHLLVEKIGYQKIADLHSMRVNAVYKRVNSLKKRGKLPINFGEDHVIEQKVPDDTILKDLYLNKGWGVYKISKEYGITETTVTRHLRRLNILQSSRQTTPSGAPRRSRRPSSAEFTDGTKKERFKEENGICEICKKKIGNGINWRQATYHHRTPIKNGGGSSKENCMVLHTNCHEDNFYELHGFSIEVLENYAK